MEPSHLLWARCIEWAGLDVLPGQLMRLGRYRDWLVTEAVEAGGLGPNEPGRIDRRHVGDSLLFASGFEKDPARMLDVGTGVGLPGIPLSIVMPETRFVLLDRSGRRIDLLRRVCRILNLGNVEVVQGDLRGWEGQVDGMVSRASVPPEQAAIRFPAHLTRGGTAVLGGSWSTPPVVAGFDVLEVPATVLDQRVWLLIMRAQ